MQPHVSIIATSLDLLKVSAVAVTVFANTAAYAQQETSVSGSVTYNTDTGKTTWSAGASQSNTKSSEHGSSTTKVEVRTDGKNLTGGASQTTTRR